MSHLPDVERHREAQALPLSGMTRNQAGDSGGLQKVGAKGENVEERVEVTKRHSPRSTEAEVCQRRASSAIWSPTALC